MKRRAVYLYTSYSVLIDGRPSLPCLVFAMWLLCFFFSHLLLLLFIVFPLFQNKARLHRSYRNIHLLASLTILIVKITSPYCAEYTQSQIGHPVRSHQSSVINISSFCHHSRLPPNIPENHTNHMRTIYTFSKTTSKLTNPVIRLLRLSVSHPSVVNLDAHKRTFQREKSISCAPWQQCATRARIGQGGSSLDEGLDEWGMF